MMVDRISRLARVRSFLRCFLVQGSWNNRSMIGAGFGFAILPILRAVFQDRGDLYEEAVERHSEHFNAHPYLVTLALGAVSHMEEEGRDPEEIRRFKQALRGPLGGLGDQLVWVGWRPATVLCALVLALAGAPPWATVVFFLLSYNAGHLLLRVWGYRVGLEWGSQVGDSLRSADLPRKANRLAAVAVFLLGGSVGLAFTRALESQPPPLLLLCVTGGIWGIWLGSLVGQRGWRWTYWGVAAVIGILFLVGRIV